MGEWGKVWGGKEEEDPSSPPSSPPPSPSLNNSNNNNPFSRKKDPIAPLLILTSPVDLEGENKTVLGQITSVGIAPAGGVSEERKGRGGRERVSYLPSFFFFFFFFFFSRSFVRLLKILG